MTPTLVLFDDRVAREWMPFVLTRPAGELLYGTCTLRARAERAFGLPCAGHLSAPHLASFDEPDAPSVLDAARLPRDRDLILLSSRAVPMWNVPPTLPESGRSGPIVLGDEICGYVVAAGSQLPPPEFFDEPMAVRSDEEPALSLEGEIIERPWHLVAGNADRIAADIEALFPGHRDPVPSGVHVLGDAPLVLGEGVEIEPGVVIDLRGGPVWLDRGVRISAHTRLAGPAYVGPDSQLLGGPYEAVSLGPVCRTRGEIEASIILGYSNKAHEGFLGHSYLGRWVNLGALTTNSDLKNTYGAIRMWTPGGMMDTGETKLGCFLGDHVKTAIGTLLNTGTVIGAGTNVFGERMPANYVPPFTWGTGDAPDVYGLEKFLETAEKVMRRRQVELTDSQRALLRSAWHLGTGREP